MLRHKKEDQLGYNREMFGEPAPGRGEEAAPLPGVPESDLLERQLGPGETVIWRGKPQKLHPAGGAFGRLFGWVWLGFACFWELIALTVLLRTGIVGLLFPLFGIPFVLIGLKLVFPNLLGKRRLAGTVYAVTNRRVLVVTESRVTAWPVSSIEGVEKRYYSDGTGDLVLDGGQTRTTWNDGHAHTRSVTLDLLGLADVDAAEAALRSQLMV
ncbi:hypothetical protein [Allofournierella sp.]|uniref:hypothetical protein n=1 Tax=Allofournierella sp. TaxID=1940256 RepID=UPI003AB9158C